MLGHALYWGGSRHAFPPRDLAETPVPTPVVSLLAKLPSAVGQASLCMRGHLEVHLGSGFPAWHRSEGPPFPPNQR